MKTVFYKKVGRRYEPVSEYDSTLMDAFPQGSHLVICYPGGKSTRYNIDPNYAALIAAGRIAEDTISQAIVKASELRPKNKAITPEQKAAWENLIQVFGEDARYLEWPSARGAAEEVVRVLQEEANKLMNNESVKLAYEQFLLTCELCKEHDAKT
jgi:hypothetical protein